MPKLEKLPTPSSPLNTLDYLIGIKDAGDGTYIASKFRYNQIPVGVQGATGVQGVQGERGEQGEQGIQGIQGIKGDKGDKGDTGATGVSGLTWQGSWASGASYTANDAVAYSGSSYFCILATSGTTAPNLDTTHWALLASQGAKGDQGEKGDKGDQGEQGVRGLQGIQGLQGVQGNTGATGATGAQGAQGIQGVPGIDANPSSTVKNIGTTMYGNVTSVTIVDGGSGIVVGAIYEIGGGVANMKCYIRITAVTSGVATACEILYSGRNQSTQTNSAYLYSGTGSSSITVSYVATAGYVSYGYYDSTGFVSAQLALGRTIKQITKDQKAYINGVDFTQWEGYLQASTFTFDRNQKLIFWT